MKLNGQVAIVTGGGRGLGQAYALALSAAGAAVAVTARTTAEIDAVAHTIRQGGGRALAITTDVTDPTAVIQMVTEVEQTLGPVSLLINNAGLLRAIGRIPDIEADAWWREVEVNVVALSSVARRCCQV